MLKQNDTSHDWDVRDENQAKYLSGIISLVKQYVNWNKRKLWSIVTKTELTH